MLNKIKIYKLSKMLRNDFHKNSNEEVRLYIYSLINKIENGEFNE